MAEETTYIDVVKGTVEKADAGTVIVLVVSPLLVPVTVTNVGLFELNVGM